MVLNLSAFINKIKCNKLIFIAIVFTMIVSAVANEGDTKKLHFLFFGFPAHGHTNPTLILTKGLVNLGHKVTYLSTSDFKESIEKSGAQFLAYESKSLNKVLSGQVTPNDVHKALLASALEMLPYLLKLNDTKQFDAVIYDSVSALWGQVFGEKHKLPTFCSTTTFLFTKEDVAERMPQFMPKVDEEYMQYLGLMQKEYCSYLKSYEDVLDMTNGTKADRIIVYSSLEFQLTPRKYKEEQCIYLGNRFDSTYKPSTKNLLSSRSVIYISLGTVFNRNINLLKTLINALKSKGHKIIISAGGDDNIYTQLKSLQVSGNHVQVHKFVDQKKILRETALFITHAGMNSVYEGLYFEVPIILIPQMQEQQINALRVQELKAGYVLDNDRITEEEIENAYNEIKQNWKAYKESCHKIRETFLASPNGIKAATEIESIVYKAKASRN